MEQEYIKNIDSWIKETNEKIAEIKMESLVLEEAVDNIQHNYELIMAMKEDIQRLQIDIQTFKILHIFETVKKIEAVYEKTIKEKQGIPKENKRNAEDRF